MSALPTPSQTAGPFFRIGLAQHEHRNLVDPGTSGAIAINGRIIDGHGEGIPDALVEIWQADPDGHLDKLESGALDTGPGPSGWTGFGRCLTEPSGTYHFTTTKPGPVDSNQAPHIDVSVFARGLLQRLVTRMYFPQDPKNSTDPVLIAAGDRASTLIATKDNDGVRFDIVLQGDNETVFFDW